MPTPQPVTLVVTGRSLHHSALMYRMRNGRWGPVPRSAPPQLSRRRLPLAPSSAASTRSMRVASAHSAKASQTPPRLSIDDVYMLAERTRMRTSLESRQLVLTKTQKAVRNDSGMSRPMSGWMCQSYSQGQGREVITPGHGTESNKGGEETDEDGGPGFVSNVEISIKSRNTSASNRSGCNTTSNKRLSSALTTASSYLGFELACVSPRPEEPESRKMSVARQCCEVMGPGVCRDCQKLRVRMMDRERMEADFPRLRVSEKNVTTSAIVKRVLPDMTQAEIQDKIARGEIARSGLLFRPRRRCNGNDNSDDEEEDKENDDRLRHNGLHGQPEENEDSDGSEDRDSRGTYSSDSRSASEKRGSDIMNRTQSGKSVNSIAVLTKLKLRFRGEASTPLFFMDLKHQNAKIFNGRVTKSLKPPKQEEKRENLPTVPNPMYPTFVSPRKSRLIEEPTYKVYFDPPLLAKDKQISNPSFFAGSDDAYSLPERLPDVLEFADGKMSITDPSAALRSESSMSFVSAVSEEGPEQLSQRGDVFKVNKMMQETVQE